MGGGGVKPVARFLALQSGRIVGKQEVSCEKLGITGGRSLTLSHCCLFPSGFRDRIVRHALPYPGIPGEPYLGTDSLVLVSELGSWNLDGPGDSTEAGESPLELAVESHLRRGPRRPKQAQPRASAPVSSRSRGPRQIPGPSPGVSAPVC